ASSSFPAGLADFAIAADSAPGAPPETLISIIVLCLPAPEDRAAKNVSGIDGNALSPRDQALKEAARSVAEQILRAPDPA
ncbi:hypothetical protein ACC719_36480, partial [Rhizobium ruizarguesonis]